MEHYNYTPTSMKFKGGILVSRRPSICTFVRLFVDKMVSALYLSQY